MQTRTHKESSSVSPTSTHIKSNGSDGSRSFSVQRQPEINSSPDQEIPSYSRNAADSLIANVMRSMEAREQGEEAQGYKGQEKSGAASVAQVVMPKQELPIAPAASVSHPSGEMGIQRQCSECEQGMEEGKDSDEMSSVAGIQTKLTVGAVGDRYEQEADRVAAQVMSMSVSPNNSPQVQRFGEEDNPVQRWSLAQSITPVVHRRVDEQVQMRSLVQRAFHAGGNEASGDLESRLNASKSGGSALAPEVRAFMEPRFGADFSSVWVHTGGEAVQMNRELGAQAFTHGSDVYFGAGKSPGNNELTAHELTHVVQQTSSTNSPIQRECGVDESCIEEPNALDSEPNASYPELNYTLAIPEPNASYPEPNTSSVMSDPLVEGFNHEFRSILHSFESSSQGNQTEENTGEGVSISSGEQATPVSRPGSRSGNLLDAEQLQELFTDTQRAKLLSFIQTREIPDRLFNGDDMGQATAQQRLLMSAHILANGQYRPGSFEQQVHARMCFHWVHIVHHYAGVTPAGGLNRGIMGSFDQSGNIILGAGGNQSVFFGGKTFSDELPEDEEAGLGPIHEGTSHADTATREAEQRQEDPEMGQQVHRRQALPFERFEELQPGDWLWYYNGNASTGGSHSVIFSRWASSGEEVDGVRFRRAIAFSQGTPAGGGREHPVNLGEQFRPSDHIFPITYVTRVRDNAQPANTVEELLPNSPGRREAQLQQRNLQFLARIERTAGRPVDLEQLKEHLRTENREHIAALSNRLTEGQQQLLQQANSRDSLETLIRLTQRLRSLRTNAAILEGNMRQTYDGNLDTRHAEASRLADEEAQRTLQRIEAIDSELTPIQQQHHNLTERLEALDPNPEIRELGRQSRSLWQSMQSLTRGHPDRERLSQERQEILARIRQLQSQQRSHRRDIQAIRTEIRNLERRSARLERQRRQLQSQQDQRQRSLPYGLVHPGRLGGQSQDSITGSLESLFTRSQMQQFLQESP